MVLDPRREHLGAGIGQGVDQHDQRAEVAAADGVGGLGRGQGQAARIGLAAGRRGFDGRGPRRQGPGGPDQIPDERRDAELEGLRLDRPGAEELKQALGGGHDPLLATAQIDDDPVRRQAVQRLDDLAEQDVGPGVQPRDADHAESAVRGLHHAGGKAAVGLAPAPEPFVQGFPARQAPSQADGPLPAVPTPQRQQDLLRIRRRQPGQGAE